MAGKNIFIDIRTKLLITLVNIVFIVSVGKGEYRILFLYLMVAFLIIILLRPRLNLLIKRASLVFLYPIFISIFIPFLGTGENILIVDLKIFDLIVTDNGLTTFFTVILKSFLSILLLTTLIASSGEIELLRGLRKIYFPKIIVSVIFLMYRYLFLIREEARIGQLAINSRVFQKSYRSVNKKLAFLAGNLVIRSFDRAENVYRSMESRGFDGNFHTVEKQVKNNKLNIFVISIFILIPISLKAAEFLSIL